MTTNTEKPTTKAEMKKQGVVKTQKKQEPIQTLVKQQKSDEKFITKTKKIAETKVSEDKQTDNKKTQTDKTSDSQLTTKKSASEASQIKSEPKASEDKKPEKKKKPIQKTPKVKKTEAIVRGVSLPLSTKYSAAICKFIKNKKIEKAIIDLEDVLKQKKVIPMKGEIPHKKGKGIMSGRFPKKATEHFIKRGKPYNCGGCFKYGFKTL